MEKELLVIDTDCGVDDSLAIVLALTHHRCQVKAITCCYGNTSLENVKGNVCRTLKTCGIKDIPVYSGCESSLLGKINEATFHGTDGFGGIASSISIDEYKLQEEHAVDALIKLVNDNTKKITLVALGPLTNLALAIKLDPKFSSKLKQLLIMGGNINATGNHSMAAEFNFYCDPEAASLVLRDFKCPILCVPWETCMDTPFSWETYEELKSIKTEKGKFFRLLTEHSSNGCRIRGRKGYHSCDFYAMAALLYPESIKETREYYAKIELAGKHTRGQMVLERRPWIQTTPNIKVVLQIDIDTMVQALRNMLQS